MHALTLFLLPIAAMGRSHHHGINHRHASRQSPRLELVTKHEGASFFDGFTYWTRDVTNGSVNFLGWEDNHNAGLAYIDPTTGAAVLSIDHSNDLPLGTKRNSVQIISNSTYTGGLFIADFAQMPYGVGVQASYSGFGVEWPQGGEIDIVSYSNDESANQYTLKSAASCDLNAGVTSPWGTGQGKAYIGAPQHQNCIIGSGSQISEGCTFMDSNTTGSAGAPFNAAGGGIFAHYWDTIDGSLSIWRWTHDNAPDDVGMGSPDPTGWGAPQAYWAQQDCDMAHHMANQSLFISTTICGTLSGLAVTTDYPAGEWNCTDLVADPQYFLNAQWMINSITVYQVPTR